MISGEPKIAPRETGLGKCTAAFEKYWHPTIYIYIESFMNCSLPTTMALAHTQIINRYDHNRDIAALSDNGLEYENCKAERTSS
jgi:hypothetical protein